MGSSSEQEHIHVAVGVIRNAHSEILVSRRKPQSHMGGLLEFPGGKVEQTEAALDALKRELKEELSIEVSTAVPLIQIPYRYPECDVLLDVFIVHEYSGTITSNEDQEIIWKSLNSLNDLDFPDANFGIFRALRLPKLFPVTPDYTLDINFMHNFDSVVASDEIEVIQLRSHNLSDEEYISLAKDCADLCAKNNKKLILNREIIFHERIPFSGMHFTSRGLLSLSNRPLGVEYLVGASCHNVEEIEKANHLKLDYIFVGAVLEKIQDEKQETLGWEGFARLVKDSEIPAYAIGGVSANDISASIHSGGQGIAAIRSTWAN